jgi:hypothetical protein
VKLQVLCIAAAFRAFVFRLVSLVTFTQTFPTQPLKHGNNSATPYPDSWRWLPGGLEPRPYRWTGRQENNMFVFRAKEI